MDTDTVQMDQAIKNPESGNREPATSSRPDIRLRISAITAPMRLPLSGFLIV